MAAILSALAGGRVAAEPQLQPQPQTCDVTEFGAKGDGRALDTAAIQRAIDACAAAGGGVAVLAHGAFLSGTIVLKDGVTLRIQPGAALVASPRIEDFTPHPPEDVPKIAIDGSTQNKGNGPYHLIDAEGAHDIGLDGGGEIQGNGAAYWDKAADGKLLARRPRPSPLIEFVASRGIRIEHLTIRGAPGWTIHPLESAAVLIRDVRIFNDPEGPNTDGIDVDSSRDVLIDGAHIEAWDDCVVLKTTGRRGGKVPATENVLVRNLECSSQTQGFKIGTESLGDFRNIALRGARIFQAPGFAKPATGAISISMVDGAILENVLVQHVRIRDAHTPIFVRLGNRGRGQAVPTPGKVRHVMLDDIEATGGDLASSITGLPGHPVEDVTLKDVRLRMKGGGQPFSGEPPEAAGDYPHAPMFGPLPAFGLFARHVRGLALKNVQLTTDKPDARPPMVLEDVEPVVHPQL